MGRRRYAGPGMQDPVLAGVLGEGSVEGGREMTAPRVYDKRDQYPPQVSGGCFLRRFCR